MTKKFLTALMLSPLFLAGCGCSNASKSNPLKEPLSIKCVEGDGATINYECEKTDSTSRGLPKLQYSLNKKDWTDIEISADGGKIADLKKGETIYLRGDNPEGFNYYNGSDKVAFKFAAENDKNYTKKFEISGNIMSLLSKKDYAENKTIPCDGCFNNIFASGFGLYNQERPTKGTVDASELQLPATTFKDYAYTQMFGTANSHTEALLTKAPKKLPATKATKSCYESMFCDVKFMVTAPEISLELLADNACYYMFGGCNALSVFDNENDGKIKFFTCPKTDGLVTPVDNMFKDTKYWDTTKTVTADTSYFYSI